MNVASADPEAGADPAVRAFLDATGLPGVLGNEVARIDAASVRAFISASLNWIAWCSATMCTSAC